MTSSVVKYPPAKPRTGKAFKPITAAAMLAGAFLGLWWSAARVVTSFRLPLHHLHAPGADQLALYGAAVTVGYALAAAAAYAQHHQWVRAMEAQRVYEAIARVARLDRAQSTRMRVLARTGPIPSDVRVRVEYAPTLLTDPTRRNLVGAFAEATGSFPEDVRIGPARGGVRLWVEHPTDDHTAPARPTTPTREVAVVEEPAAPPVPARAPAEGMEEQIAEVMRGVLGSDRVDGVVTETHTDGYPAEVWVTYPPRLSASVTEALVRMRSTLEQVCPTRSDEWAVRLVGPKCRVVFTDRVDPLGAMVTLPDVDPNPDLHKGVVVGINEAGAPWRMPLMGGMHTLVAGASQAGKGSVLWNIVRAVGPMIADRRVRLWIIDPKGGMEFSAAKPIAHRFAVGVDDAETLLADLREVMQAKSARLAAEGRRKIEAPTAAEPLDLLIVDELANVTGLAGKAGITIGDHIAALCSMGRAPAVTVIGALQDPRKETFRHRGLFTSAVAMRLREAGETNLVLGQGARAQGALADLIPVRYPGIGYVIRDDRAEPERVRTAFVSDTEIDALVKRATPALDAPPIGDPVLTEDPDPLVVTTKPSPKASSTTPPTGAGRPVRVKALNLPAVAYFDGDPDPVRITDCQNDPDEDDRLLVTYFYEGEPTSRTTSVEEDEVVRVVS